MPSTITQPLQVSQIVLHWTIDKSGREETAIGLLDVALHFSLVAFCLD